MTMKTALGLALSGLLLSACATTTTPPSADWMGAEAEKGYDKALDAKRMAELMNNDDYFQVEKDGRIYAFSDLAAYKLWLKTGEVPLVVTQIGGGPNGETLKLQLTKADAKAMETRPGYKGAAQRMFEGDLKGIDIGFYAEVVTDTRYYVFSDWKDLASFRTSRDAPCGITSVGGGPDGKTVQYVQSCKAAQAGKPDQAIAKFKANYNIN